MEDELFSVRNMFWLGNYDAAIDEALQVQPRNDRERIDRDVYVYRSYIGKGNYNKVINEVNESAATDVLAVKLFATFMAQPPARDAVVETLQEWLADENTRDNATVQLIAGLLFYRLGDTKEALRGLRANANLEVHALKVQIYLSMNRTDLASNELQVMQNIDDDSAVTQLAMAWVYLASGGPKYQEAAYIYQEQIDKTASSALLLNGLGTCYLQMKRFDEAEKYLEEAHEKDPSDADVMVNLLSAYKNLHRPVAKAEPIIKKLRAVGGVLPIMQQLVACEKVFDKVAAQHAQTAQTRQ